MQIALFAASLFIVFTAYVSASEVQIDPFVMRADQHEHCSDWASLGECEKNPLYMKVNCQLSCGQFGKVSAGGASLIDQHPHCSNSEATNGECAAQSSKLNAVLVQDPDDLFFEQKWRSHKDLLKSVHTDDGVQRVIIDGLASQDECQALTEMATSIMDRLGPKETYLHKDYPDTLRILHFNKMSSIFRTGVEQGHHFTQFLELRQRIASKTKEMFHLSQIFNENTEITERSDYPTGSTAIEPNNGDAHGVHSDNCVGRNPCLPRRDACCYWRDFTGLLFLNSPLSGNFSQGELFFDDIDVDGERRRVAIEPACGRLVIFTSGEQNPHGVKRIYGTGRRFVMTAWMTVNPDFVEGN
jgi:hypothetical protein